MAKTKGSGGPTNKITFGKRSRGKAKKSFNKNDRTSRVYRGQGR
jgi:hypothetical protein